MYDVVTTVCISGT